MNARPSSGSHTGRPLLWGITWGVGVGVVEFLAISPIDAWGSVQQLLWWLLYWTMPYWCAIGCLFVLLADQRERVGGRWVFTGAFIALCLLSAALEPQLSMRLVALTNGLFPGLERYSTEMGALRPQRSTWGTFSLYYVWITLFYGGLLMVARIVTVRQERIRSLLHQSAMARSRTEALLDAARLEALQSQIDPHLLLDSMRDLEQRYRADPERAERLLEALVEFLRQAMPGLREAASTLEAELKLARTFAQLQQERGVDGSWHVIEEPVSILSTHAFPSLLMLPLLALGGEGGRPLLRVRAQDGQAVLSLHGLAREVSADLKQQILARLRVLYGERFRLDLPSPAHNQLTISLPRSGITSGESYG